MKSISKVGLALGALLLAALPEVLRYAADPLQAMTGGRLDASILRQLLVALAMVLALLANLTLLPALLVLCLGGPRPYRQQREELRAIEAHEEAREEARKEVRKEERRSQSAADVTPDR